MKLNPKPKSEPGAMSPATPVRVATGPVDGLRLHILLRALRGQRHDVLGPLAAGRLVVASLRRRLAADPSDLQGAQQLVEALSQQMADAVSAVALMRVWDGAAATTRPLDPLLQTCADLMRTEASLKGHQLVLLDFVQPLPAVQVKVPDAHYALLGWLAHHIDAGQQPSRFTVLRQGRAVALRIELRADLPTDAMAAPGLGSLPGMDTRHSELDADGLALLLRDVGWQQRPAGPGVWQLAWPAA